MDYNGYQGTIEVSTEDDCIFGKILHIEDLVTYEAKSPKELEAAFLGAVNDYIVFCKEEGREPNKPFKGSLNIRIGEEIHKDASMLAARLGISLNDFIKESIKERLSRGENNQAPSVVHNHSYKYVIQAEAQDVENYGEEDSEWNLRKEAPLQLQH